MRPLTRPPGLCCCMQNDHEKGHALIKEAGDWGEKAEAANTAAAAAIFKFNNEGKGDMFIDMHGLLVAEALGERPVPRQQCNAPR